LSPGLAFSTDYDRFYSSAAS